MPPLSDQDLTRWAREHLVYEARMLACTAIRLAEREERAIPRDAESNALLESFVVHVRCLSDFLWAERGKHEMDAFAFDFCEPGKWEAAHPKFPPAVAQIRDQGRAGREVVHLTYHRLDIEEAAKEWDVGDICNEIAGALSDFALIALPARLDTKTRSALDEPSSHFEGAGSPSVATGAYYRGGTIPFAGFIAGRS
jgi:hypothetical protein